MFVPSQIMDEDMRSDLSIGTWGKMGLTRISRVTNRFSIVTMAEDKMIEKSKMDTDTTRRRYTARLEQQPTLY